MATKKAPAKKSAPKKKTTDPAAIANPPSSSGFKGAIEAGPLPLVDQQQLDITVTKFPPDTDVRIVIEKNGMPADGRQMKTDPYGQTQTAIIPTAGDYHVTVKGGGVSAKTTFTVAAQ